MKNAPSALLNYISTREFLRTRAREALEKHEPQASASRTSRVFLKIRTWLYYSKMYEENVFCFFYKIVTQKQIPLLNCSETIKLQIKRRHFIYIFLTFSLLIKHDSFFSFTILTLLWTERTRWDQRTQYLHQQHMQTSIFTFQEQTLSFYNHFKSAKCSWNSLRNKFLEDNSWS